MDEQSLFTEFSDHPVGESDADHEPDFTCGPDDEHEVLARWSEQLERYGHGHAGLDALRLRPNGEPPWPQADNPMLGYLIECATSIAARDGVDAGIEWLANRAWCEATIAERGRVARMLIDD